LTDFEKYVRLQLIRKRGRNRTPKNRTKNQKTSLISSQKESLDRNHGTKIFTEGCRLSQPERFFRAVNEFNNQLEIFRICLLRDLSRIVRSESAKNDRLKGVCLKTGDQMNHSRIGKCG
jgi:hypothetical protein